MATKRIGALWTSDKTKGNSVLNGSLDFGLEQKITIYVTKNKDKRGDKSPDYVIIAKAPEYTKKPNGGGAKDPFVGSDDSPF